MKNDAPRPPRGGHPSSATKATADKLEGILSVLLIFALVSPASAALVAPDVQTYDGLLRAIREVQAASQKRVEQAIDQEKVREAWETGKLIDAHVLQHKERAGYGEKVLKRLSGDLGISESELYRMLEFARSYPNFAAPQELSWAHYRELLSVDNKQVRKEVTDEAVRQHWSHRQVRAEVRRRQAGSVSQEPEKLEVASPGNLYTYRVVRPDEGPYAGQLALDLGFDVTFRPPAFDLGAFKEGDTVALRDGMLTKVKDPVGTYQAYVTEIIDADTFHARIDLGFGITIHQKLRLRGLDAPQVESADGREAKAFLEEHLAAPAPGTPVLIKTSKSDKYDRYLADVWLPLRSDKASSGGAQTTRDEQWIYVNQLLLDQGLAVRVEE